MPRKIRLGVLTPSSNTALEPLTQAIVASLPGVSAHFARFPVTEISLRTEALGQFRLEPILQAAELLADARVDAIAWSGTSAGWMGFDADEALCAAIEKRAGIPATSSVLALNELMQLKGVTRLGLVTPYVPDVQQRIIANYEAIGVHCVDERHLDLSVNYAFAEVTGETLLDMIRQVAAARPQAITTFCTNLHAAAMAERVEAELGVPLLDTVSTAVWGLLRKAGADPGAIAGWGSMFGWGSPGLRNAV
jgi:maleate isomerase